MQDLFTIPSCFSSGEKLSDVVMAAPATRSGESIVILSYRAKIAGHFRLITVTWCKNLLGHGLSISAEKSDHQNDDKRISAGGNVSGDQYTSIVCKVEMRPWSFWRKHGSKRFHVETGKSIHVFWDLQSAKFSDEAEPRSGYYVAVVSDNEVVLLLGDLKKEAFCRTGSRPSVAEAVLVSKKEHVFGKKRFSTRAKFHEKGKLHEISIELNNGALSRNADSGMVVKIDGHAAIVVSHLQWKFRGNQSISINKRRVEVYWNVHDWLFSFGLRHALFIFKPEPETVATSASTSSSSSSCSWSGNGVGDGNRVECCGFCLFLYAWKVE